MKTIKINLSESNGSKRVKLAEILDLIEVVQTEYLTLRKLELDSKQYLHFKSHYANFRARFPSLNSAILQNSLHRVDEVIKSYVSWCKKKHRLVQFPERIEPSIPLRNDCFHFEYNEKSKTFDAWLVTLRTKFPLKLCDFHRESLADLKKIGDSAIGRDRHGKLCLRLSFHSNVVEKTGDKVLGIDVGIVQPIVFSDGKHIGNGRLIKHKKKEFGKKRARCASLKQAITAKQVRWTNDLNHKLSREAVQYALLKGADVLALEALKGTELSNRKFRKFNWAFKDLLTKIEYKAQAAGLRVICVNPKHTSQMCSSCGSKSKDNRQSQSLFHCESCGTKLNADVNAAKNIAALSSGEATRSMCETHLSSVDGVPLTAPRGKAKSSNQPTSHVSLCDHGQVESSEARQSID